MSIFLQKPRTKISSPRARPECQNRQFLQASRILYETPSNPESRITRDFKIFSMPANEDQVLNINCMNCQELISIDNIEEHSRLCTTISQTMQSLESGPYLSQVIYRLRKYDACLLEMSKNSELRPGDKNYISIFSRLCQKALSVTCIEETDSILKSFSSLLVTFKGSLSIRIYADRLQSLVQEQKLGYQEIEIENTKAELDKIKEEAEKYKTYPQVPLKTILRASNGCNIEQSNKKVTEITSDLGSLNSGISELTRFSLVDEEKQELDEIITENLEDLQKHFYSLCISIKMKNNIRARNQILPIQKLYQEAIDNNIPPES